MMAVFTSEPTHKKWAPTPIKIAAIKIRLLFTCLSNKRWQQWKRRATTHTHTHTHTQDKWQYCHIRWCQSISHYHRLETLKRVVTNRWLQLWKNETEGAIKFHEGLTRLRSVIHTPAMMDVVAIINSAADWLHGALIAFDLIRCRRQQLDLGRLFRVGNKSNEISGGLCLRCVCAFHVCHKLC